MFYLVECVIYAVFLGMDTLKGGGGAASSLVKYAGLILCAARGSALPALAGEPGRRRRLLKTLLWLAAGADIFLLSGSHIAIGLVLFMGVQYCYSQFWIRSKRRQVWFLGTAAAAVLILFLAAGPEDTVLAGGYAVLLAQNAVGIARNISGSAAGTGCSRGKAGEKSGTVRALIRIAAGTGCPCGKVGEKSGLSGSSQEALWIIRAITLLLLCDIHVGLYNLLWTYRPRMSFAFARWYDWTGTAMWFFYLPSMLCVVRAAETVGKGAVSGKRNGM